jgi:predicted ABC-type ATPase
MTERELGAADAALREHITGFVFDDDEYRGHAGAVLHRLDALRRAGVDSRTLYGQLDRGWVRWSAGRRRQQRLLLQTLWERQAPQVPREGKAMIIAGVDGAGKTTLQSDPECVDIDQYLVADADRIEATMAEFGLIPSVDGLSPMEASPLVHEEAWELAERLAQRAYHEKCNILWEIPFNSDESGMQRIEALQDAGYAQVNGAFADVSVDIACERSDLRHRRCEEAYRNGQGCGGRLTPRDVFESCGVAPDSERERVPHTAVKSPVSTTATVRRLVEQFGLGRIDFDTLVAGLVDRWGTRYEKQSEPTGWAEIFRRAEEMPDDDDLFWVSVAEDLGILSVEQAEAAFTAIERTANGLSQIDDSHRVGDSR